MTLSETFSYQLQESVPVRDTVPVALSVPFGKTHALRHCLSVRGTALSCLSFSQIMSL